MAEETLQASTHRITGLRHPTAEAPEIDRMAHRALSPISGVTAMTIIRELTQLNLPPTLVQRGLQELCESCGYTSIRYDPAARQFYGVRLIEDQEETK